MHVPPTVTVYEAIRVSREARRALTALGVTSDLYEYRLEDAARILGLPPGSLGEVLAPQPKR